MKKGTKKLRIKNQLKGLVIFFDRKQKKHLKPDEPDRDQ
jgi:hypothetical protein